MTRRAARNTPWIELINLGTNVNHTANDSGPCLSADGLTLFFDSDRPGGYGNSDLWATSRTATSEPWGEAVNLGPIVNSPADETIAHISADGSTLYFGSNRPGGYGGRDIWDVRILGMGSESDPNSNLGLGGMSKKSDTERR